MYLPERRKELHFFDRYYEVLREKKDKKAALAAALEVATGEEIEPREASRITIGQTPEGEMRVGELNGELGGAEQD